jgi:DNA methylase
VYCPPLGLVPLNLIVWAKTNAGMGSLYRSQHELLPLFRQGTAPHVNNVELGKRGRWRSNVWTYPGASSLGSDARRGLKDHPTVKPTAMLEDALLDLSNRGDFIIDPFLGSADPQRGLSIEVLQIIRRLLIRSDRFRLEREVAGPDFHRGERCALPRHTEQSSREFASADPAAGAQDAAVQEPGLSPEIPVNACRRLQHLQRPTSSHFSSNAPRTSGCGDGHMADRRRSSLKIPDRRRFALAPWQCDNPM